MFTLIQDTSATTMPSLVSWADGAVVDAKDSGEFASLVLEPEITVLETEELTKRAALFLPVPVIDRVAQVFDLADQQQAADPQLARTRPDQPKNAPLLPIVRPLPDAVCDKDRPLGERPLPNMGADVPQPLGQTFAEKPLRADQGSEQMQDEELAAVPDGGVAVAALVMPVPYSVAGTRFVPANVPLEKPEGGEPEVSPPIQAASEGGLTFDLPDTVIEVPMPSDAPFFLQLAGLSAPKTPVQIASPGDLERIAAGTVVVPDIVSLPEVTRPASRSEDAAFFPAPVPPNHWKESVGPERTPDRQIRPPQDEKAHPVSVLESEPLPTSVPVLRSPLPVPQSLAPDLQAVRYHDHATEIVALKITSEQKAPAVPTERVAAKDIAPMPLNFAQEVPDIAKPAQVGPPPVLTLMPEMAATPDEVEDLSGAETPTDDPTANDPARQTDVPQGRQGQTPLYFDEPGKLPSVPTVDVLQAVNINPVAGPLQTLQPGQGLPGGASRQGHLPPARQVAEAVVAKAENMAPGRIEITLAPETLGKVHFDMQSDKSGVSITLSAERPETLELIRRNLPDLAAELKQVGIETGSFHFGSWNGKGQADGQPVAPQTAAMDFDPIPARPVQQIVPRQMTGLAQLDIRL